MNNYEDIINLDRPKSKHIKQSIESRASQFAPFAALSGYDKAVKEIARLTDEKRIIDDSVKIMINDKLNYLNSHINENIEVSISYFEKDKYKSGGKYIVKNGIIKKIDSFNKIIKFLDNFTIKMSDIENIDITNKNR